MTEKLFTQAAIISDLAQGEGVILSCSRYPEGLGRGGQVCLGVGAVGPVAANRRLR